MKKSMKKVLTSTFNIKFNACIIFAGTMIIFMVIALFTKEASMDYGKIWQGLIISFIGAVIQWFAFSEDVFKKLKYVYRNIIFIALFLPMLALFAYFGGWIDESYAVIGWMIFMGIFILAFIGISIGFAVYFKATGQKYNLKLEKYKAEK